MLSSEDNRTASELVEALKKSPVTAVEFFDRNGYPDAVINGHALDGNYHFILNQFFDTPEANAQYDKMMREVILIWWMSVRKQKNKCE